MDHWRAVKKVMRYLKWTNDQEVIGYLDSDFVSCVESRKSTLRYIFMIAGGAVS